MAFLWKSHTEINLLKWCVHKYNIFVLVSGKRSKFDWANNFHPFAGQQSSQGESSTVAAIFPLNMGVEKPPISVKLADLHA